MDVKLTWFHNVSRSLTDKLDSLWKLAEAHQPGENEIKQFADQIANSWTCVNRQVKLNPLNLILIPKKAFLLNHISLLLRIRTCEILHNPREIIF